MKRTHSRRLEYEYKIESSNVYLMFSFLVNLFTKEVFTLYLKNKD